MAKRTAVASSVSADEALIEEAKKRFARCEDRESSARVLWKADLKFANGDPDNGYQWDDAMAKQRDADGRPYLTVNKVKQHNRQITNDARQNKPSVRVYPVDGGADKKTAEVFNGIIRHIEANSSADTAYDTAGEFAVDAGLGYWRVTTDYAADDTFDQEIYIKAVKNPLNVYLDPDIQEADGSDARFGFVFENMSKEEFEDKYPDADMVAWPSTPGDNWLGKDVIRLAEYYKIIETKDTLCLDMNSGESFMLSTIDDKDQAKAIRKNPQFKTRPVAKRSCKWYLIAGDQVLETTDWLGKYIPIVRVVGDEVEIDGKVDRKGHTRPMKDAQRMYNYNSSAAIEYGALQTKTPIIAAAEAIEGYENYWDNANTQNTPYLPYNAATEDGRPLPTPQRMVAPAPAQLFLQGMATASEEMKMASGQYDASMGAKSNETSGRAIMARQREGDTATFHFIDNVARAIKFTGKILVDLIPKIYDTPRVVRILGEDGKDDKVHIDPQQKQSMVEQQDPRTQEIKEIYNPSVGRYDVTVSVGPSYGTKRQEAFQALTELSSRNPQLMQVAGDLIMKAADFPMADQLAERLERTLPPGIKDQEGGAKIPPEVQQQMDQMKQHTEMLEKSLQEIGEKYNDLDDSREIDRQNLLLDRYRAETDRLKLIYPTMPTQIAKVLAKEFGLDLIAEQQQEALGQQKGVQPAAQQAIAAPPPEIQVPPDPDMAGAPPMEQEQQEQQQEQPEPPAGGFFTPESMQAGPEAMGL